MFLWYVIFDKIWNWSEESVPNNTFCGQEDNRSHSESLMHNYLWQQASHSTMWLPILTIKHYRKCFIYQVTLYMPWSRTVIYIKWPPHLHVYHVGTWLITRASFSRTDSIGPVKLWLGLMVAREINWPFVSPITVRMTHWNCRLLYQTPLLNLSHATLSHKGGGLLNGSSVGRITQRMPVKSRLLNIWFDHVDKWCYWEWGEGSVLVPIIENVEYHIWGNVIYNTTLLVENRHCYSHAMAFMYFFSEKVYTSI